MADVRALLKAKRQEARITHPLASYSSSGQLRCSVCGTIVKHSTAWEGHLGSKAHRTNVARLREEERLRQEAKQRDEEQRQAASLGKRKSPASDEDEDEDEEMAEPESKKSKPNGAGRFPVDFFSDATRAPLPMDVDGDGEESVPKPDRPPAPAPAPGSLEYEFARFQREVVNAPDALETYANATVFAEAVLAPEVPEGFPQQKDEAPVEDVVDEQELKRRKAQEERELIMDRLLEEERVQEEADMKVTVLKTRLDALKRKRQAAKANKANAGS